MDGSLTIGMASDKGMANQALMGIMVALLTLAVAEAQVPPKSENSSPTPGDISAPMLQDYSCNKKPIRSNR